MTTARPQMPQSQRPSLAMIAQQAGVSVATVSRIVNGDESKASPATVERVRQLVKELRYRPSNAGIALRSRQSRSVAVLLANAANPSMVAIAASIERALRARGLVMILADTHEDPEVQDEHLLEMHAHLVRAHVVIGPVDSAELHRFSAAGEAMVFVGRRPPEGVAGAFVGIDNALAGRQVADWLIDQGHLPAAIIHPSLESSATADRVAGLVECLTGRGQELAGRVQFDHSEPDHLIQGYQGADRLLSEGKPIRGLYCGSDLIAYGAHRRLREAGYSVPDQICLVGFDDNPLNDWVAPWLTSVRVPYESFGPAVIDALDDIWAGQTSVEDRIFPHELIVRKG